MTGLNQFGFQALKPVFIQHITLTHLRKMQQECHINHCARHRCGHIK